MAEDDNGPQSVSQPVTFGRRPVAQRADARRNRQRMLEAARELVDERGLDGTSVEEIASLAGVGKGTFFRAFGDKAGLARALLDTRERQLQAEILGGSPPLGRDETPQRVIAFIAAYVDLLESDADLLLVADHSSVGDRYHTAAYAGWLLYLTSLMQRLHAPVDAEAAAHSILAVLSAELYVHLRRHVGFSVDRVRAMAEATARAMMTSATTE